MKTNWQELAQLQSLYFEMREDFVNNPDRIVALEQKCQETLVHALLVEAPAIKHCFDRAMNLTPFWLQYAPKQRGHKPRGDSLPWGEVGEKVLEGFLYKIACAAFTDSEFLGLPYGHDVRFFSGSTFMHIDVKSTGPNDNPDEVVSSPNQVSGDGSDWDSMGVINRSWNVIGPRQIPMIFQPELPPFYIINGQPVVTVTIYLKCVYKVLAPGNQPLSYLELICVPNGLLMFDTLMLAKFEGLLTPGKDEVGHKHKRTRIKLNPLASIAPWRCQKIIFDEKSAMCEKRCPRQKC